MSKENAGILGNVKFSKEWEEVQRLRKEVEDLKTLLEAYQRRALEAERQLAEYRLTCAQICICSYGESEEMTYHAPLCPEAGKG